MQEVLLRLRDWIRRHTDDLGVRSVQIYHDDIEIERRLTDGELPAVALIDGGTQLEAGPIAGHVTERNTIRMQLFINSSRLEERRFDERIGMYPIMERLRGLMWNNKTLIDTCEFPIETAFWMPPEQARLPRAFFGMNNFQAQAWEWRLEWRRLLPWGGAVAPQSFIGRQNYVELR